MTVAGSTLLSRLKAGVAVAALLTVSGLAPTAAAQDSGPYPDAGAGAYYAQAVEALYENGVFSGTGCDEGFCPDDALDRATMAVWTVRVLDGEDPEAASESRFDDVDVSGFYAPFIERMAELKVTRGCGDGSGFCPNHNVTRAEMAVFLSRAFKLPEGPDPGFVDVPADAWYAADVARLAASKITVGCGDSSGFCPGRDTTRAQMATFLHRAISRAGLSVELESSTGRAVGGSFEVGVSFARPVTGFGLGDVVVVNGRATRLAGSGSDYEVTVVPSAEGTVVVRIPAGAARDGVGNPNQASGLLVSTLASGGYRDGPGFDVWDREAVARAYRAEFEREQPDPGFTGNVADCDAGTTSQPFRDSVVQRVNWYRQMAGLPTVAEREQYSQSAQQAAMMMSAQGSLSHYPDQDWACYNSEGALGASHSNLGLGSAGVYGIDSFMRDNGPNNTSVGHRRWILTPQLTEVGTGNIPTGTTAFALFVLGSLSQSPYVREERGFVAWPPAGYAPAETVWGRWSFQLPGVDFRSATVTVADDYSPIPVAVIHRGPGIVWAVYGDWNSAKFPGFSGGDYCYTVTISNVRVDETTQVPFQYFTCLIDPGTESDSLSHYGSPPVWSPDGTQIVYPHDGVLWTINADGTDQRLFGTFKWSPDGTRIAYTGNGIWVANTDGTNPQQLTASGSSPAWSPDGTRIAYGSFTGLGWTARSNGIWVIDTDGTNPQQLTETGRSPAWSPDDTQIAYIDNGIWVIDTDGTNPQKLAASGRSPAWSPDGTRIAYTDKGIWVVNTDGTNPQKLTERAQTLAWSWSPDGDRIIYEDSRGTWIINTDGTDRQLLAALGRSPAWSPDGTRIAYDNGIDNGIWVVNTDGTSPQQLTASGRSPAWSPDGTRIAYNEWGHQLWVVNTDGTNPQQLSK